MTLHTKYRPSQWKEVIGHEKVIKSLRTALEKNVSHTYMFVGPSGVGKTTISRIAARKVGCHERDILEIDAATYTGIDDMRQVTSGLAYRPLAGNIKAIIIDECHRLSGQAWDSILKATEEPPEWVYWFFCTTQPGKVPITMNTRCTRYTLREVATEQIADLLTDIVKKEKLDVDSSVVNLCAKAAKGSPRQGIINLGKCVNSKEKDDVRKLLEESEENAKAIDLARALLKREGWLRIQTILNDLKEENAESIRHVIRAYMTNVILGAKNEEQAGRALEILDRFSEPFQYGDGISPLVRVVGILILSGNDE